MIKFFNSKNDVQEFKEELIKLEHVSSPIKDILEKSNCVSYSFTVNNSEEKISFKDSFVLLVNIKDSSSVYFVFDSKSFKKDEALEKISYLKSIEILDISSCKNKTYQLFKIAKQYNPYFIVYKSKNGYPLFPQEVLDIKYASEMFDSPLFYIDRELRIENHNVAINNEKQITTAIYLNQKIKNLFKKNKKIEETAENASVDSIKSKSENNSEYLTYEQDLEDTIQIEKKKNKISFKEIYKNYIALDINNIKKNRYHYLFLSISSFLFGFASAVGFANVLIQKTIAILLFFGAFIGLFLMTFIYIDYLKIKKLKDKMFIYSILFNIIGIAFAIAVTMLFYQLDQSGIKDIIGTGKLICFVIGTGFLAIIIAVTLAYLIYSAKKKNKND